MMSNLKNETLFVVPNNDGEAVEIQKLLKDNGWKYLGTGQQWGASWEGLETEIKQEINSGKYKNIYGVELQGSIFNKSEKLGLNQHCIDIDHHKYENDDRTNKLSSLEQVAKIINVELTEYQKAVSYNDIHGIKGLKRKYKEYVDAVAIQDMLAQGITEEQIQIAKESVKEAERVEKLVIVRCKHSKTYPIKANINYNNIIIISEDGEINFEGDGQICLALQKEFEGWLGGNLPEYGFWGGYVDKEKVLNFVKKEVKRS